MWETSGASLLNLAEERKKNKTKGHHQHRWIMSVKKKPNIYSNSVGFNAKLTLQHKLTVGSALFCLASNNLIGC